MKEKPDKCPLCGAPIKQEFDSSNYSHDPGHYVIFRCGTKWWKCSTIRKEIISSTAPALQSDTTGPRYREIPYEWELYGDPSITCLANRVVFLEQRNKQLEQSLKDLSL